MSIGTVKNISKKVLGKVLKPILFLLVVVLLVGLISQIKISSQREHTLKTELEARKKDLVALKNEDQYKINKKLEHDIKEIEVTYTDAVKTYEQILDFRAQKNDTQQLEEKFAASLKYLSERNYASASATLASINKQIEEENKKTASSFTIPTQVTSSNTPPPAGAYKRQSVTTEKGTFMIDIISADLNSTKVLVDTASDSDCSNNCPVLPLSTYATRSGAYAAINGTFFCPTEYPSCAGKTNSFDTLLMNKNKVYFNSANNVYSTIPAVIFKDNWARFVGRSLEWGRDTGVDAVIAMQPMLVSGGSVAVPGSSDPKLINKGTRGFIGVTGNMVYIGFVQNASSEDGAYVLKALGIKDAIGLDQGGSTALWYGNYILGPGRNIPNAVLFVRK